jgi:hypothetical protein
MDQRLLMIAWAALVVQIPFELRNPWAGLSNLQWTFLALAVLNIPSLYRNRWKLCSDRLVQAAALFVAIEWMAAFFAPEFNANAWKGAIRFTAGFGLLTMIKVLHDRTTILRVWAVTATLAAIYALIAQAGFGFPWFFRVGEFFVAQVQRLSGSFEYPNTAAAYYAMSLPIVWWAPFPRPFRWAAAVAMWCALILTFSRAAIAAVVVVCIGHALLSSNRRKEWGMAAGLVAAGLIAVVLSASFSPYLLEVLKRAPVENPPGAQYRTPWNVLKEEPAVDDTLQLKIRNTGRIPWLATGGGRVSVGYKWLNNDTQQVERGPMVTALPHNVPPGEEVELSVPFQTPASPGSYLLIAEVFVRNFDWFSNAGVTPAVIEADIRHGVTRVVDVSDSARSIPVQADQRSGIESVPRLELWRAAIKMFAAHPFGVGPDNFRLMYGRFLGLTSWNTKIYSNNLYLELLTGSGLIGLASFCLMVFSMPRRAAASGSSRMAVAVFLVHGFWDVFLMTTPIYFSFWILAGTCREPATQDP